MESSNKTAVLIKVLIAMLLTFFLSEGRTAAQQLQVIQVSGTIRYQGHYVKTGMQLTAQPPLTFEGLQDFIMVMDASGHSLKLSGKPHKSSGHNWMEVNQPPKTVSENFIELPAKVYENLEKLPWALKSFHPILIEDDNRYLFNIKNFPTADSGRFFLQISLSGHKNVLHRLRVKGDTLLIAYNDFLSDYGVSPPVKFGLYFQSDSKSAIKPVVSLIKPHFDLTNDMEGMIAATVSQYKRQRLARMVAFIKCLTKVYYHLGKPAPLNFSERFEAYYSGKMDSIKIMPYRYGGVANYNRAGLKVFIRKKRHGFASEVTEILPPDGTVREYAPYPGNQGVTETCTAWACAYGARSMNYNILNNTSVRFSAEFVFQLLQKDPATCVNGPGINIRDALRVLQDTGDVILADTSYNCGRIFSPDDINNAGHYQTTGSVPLFTYTVQSVSSSVIAEIRHRIKIEKKPVIFSMFVPAKEDPITHFPRETSLSEMRLPPYRNVWQPTDIDRAECGTRDSRLLQSHTLLIVGYNDSLNHGSFEVLNSWGVNFAKKGFFWIKYADFLAFATDAFCIQNPADKVPNIVLLAPHAQKKGKQLALR